MFILIANDLEEVDISDRSWQPSNQIVWLELWVDEKTNTLTFLHYRFNRVFIRKLLGKPHFQSYYFKKPSTSQVDSTVNPHVIDCIPASVRQIKETYIRLKQIKFAYDQYTCCKNHVFYCTKKISFMGHLFMTSMSLSVKQTSPTSSNFFYLFKHIFVDVILHYLVLHFNQ